LPKVSGRSLTSFFEQCNRSLQVVTFVAGHAHHIALNCGLHLHFAVLDDAHDFLGIVAGDAVPHLDQLLDLIATHFLNRAGIEKTNIHAPFGALCDQDIADLTDLKVAVGVDRDLPILLLDLGTRALKVEAGADLFGRLVDGVAQFGGIRLEARVK